LLHNCDLGEVFSESAGQVADQRNLIQHKLVSLPSAPHSQIAATNSNIYEIMRLSTIIFSLLTIFPVTASAAPFLQLSTQLHAQLQDINIYAQSPDESSFITWAVIMGGIAAIGTPNRSWYVSILRSLYLHLGFRSWDQLKTILERFLWLGSTNDVDGIALWLELVQLHAYERQFEVSRHPELQVRWVYQVHHWKSSVHNIPSRPTLCCMTPPYTMNFNVYYNHYLIFAEKLSERLANRWVWSSFRSKVHVSKFTYYLSTKLWMRLSCLTQRSGLKRTEAKDFDSASSARKIVDRVDVILLWRIASTKMHEALWFMENISQW